MNKEIVELSKGFFEIYDYDENIEIEFPQIKGCFVNDN